MLSKYESSAGSFLGIVIQQSLQDENIAAPAQLVAKKNVNTWVFLLVRVEAPALDEHIASLQTNMVADGKWYAHYFRGQELVVVFPDSVFKVSLDRSTWGPVLEHGLKKGIPLEQLDFNPATSRGVAEFFGLRM